MLRAWPRVVCLSLGVIPVLMLAFLAATLSYQSTLAITDVGFERLTSTDFSTQYSSGFGRYGMLPALVGTVLIVTIAIGLALPVSLAMAIFATEFPLRFLGRMMRIPARRSDRFLAGRTMNRRLTPIRKANAPTQWLAKSTRPMPSRAGARIRYSTWGATAWSKGCRASC